MSDIRVVLFLVRCTQSLLLCDDIPTEHLQFRDMADCTVRMPQLVETAERSVPGEVIMGRCHYLVAKPAAEPGHHRYGEHR